MRIGTARIDPKSSDFHTSLIEKRMAEADAVRSINRQKAIDAARGLDAERGLNWEKEDPASILATHVRRLAQDSRGADIPASIRFNMSRSLLKNDKMPAIIDPSDVENYVGDEEGKYIFNQYLNDSRNYTSCHDVASELNVIFGDGPGEVFDGVGDGRSEGLRSAQDALRANRPVVITVSHKSTTGDGHSFVLFNKGNKEGKVQGVEAWAVNSALAGVGGGDLYSIMASQGLRNIDRTAAIDALQKLSSTDPAVREDGLGVLSRCCVQQRDVQGHIIRTSVREAFEMPNQLYDQLNTKVTIRPLDIPDMIQSRLASRQDILAESIQRLRS
jgi:hypothetical protein